MKYYLNLMEPGLIKVHTFYRKSASFWAIFPFNPDTDIGYWSEKSLSITTCFKPITRKEAEKLIPHLPSPAVLKKLLS